MKIAKRSAPDNEFSAGPSGGVTAENYLARTVAFIRARGGSGFVIRAIDGPKGWIATREPPTDAQWIAWVGYWARKNIPSVFSRQYGMATVPSEWPEEFDYEAPSSDRYAKLPQPAPLITFEQRRDLGVEWDRLRKSMGRVYDPFRKTYSPPPETPEQRLARLSADSISTPCPPLTRAGEP